MLNGIDTKFNGGMRYGMGRGWGMGVGGMGVGSATTTYSEDDYNDKPHGKLYGLTPNEVLNGNIPVKDNFKQDMIKARRNRTDFKPSTVLRKSTSDLISVLPPDDSSFPADFIKENSFRSLPR